MSGKNINFDDKNINKSNFYKNKKLVYLNDIDVNKILVSKENYMAHKIHLNTSMMLLDHYL